MVAPGEGRLSRIGGCRELTDTGMSARTHFTRMSAKIVEQTYLKDIFIAVISLFALCKITFDHGVDEVQVLSWTHSSFGLQRRCSRVTTLSGMNLQASNVTVKGRLINIKGTWNILSYLVDSTLSFFMTCCFLCKSSSSFLIPRAGNLCFSSANSSLLSHTWTTLNCWTFSSFRPWCTTSVLASSNDCASSDCRHRSLSEDIACDARIFRMDLISQRWKQM